MLGGGAQQPSSGRACSGPAGAGRTPACQRKRRRFHRRLALRITLYGLGVLGLCQHALHQLWHSPPRTEAAAGRQGRRGALPRCWHADHTAAATSAGLCADAAPDPALAMTLAMTLAVALTIALTIALAIAPTLLGCPPLLRVRVRVSGLGAPLCSGLGSGLVSAL